MNKQKRFVVYTNTKRVTIEAESREEAEASFMETFGYDGSNDMEEVATDD